MKKIFLFFVLALFTLAGYTQNIINGTLDVPYDTTTFKQKVQLLC